MAIIGKPHRVAMLVPEVNFHELLAPDLERVVSQALGANRRGTLISHAASAQRSSAMGRINQRGIGQLEHFLMQAVV